jgi:hypothetical protein
MHFSVTRLKLVEAASVLLLIAFLLTNCKKEYSYEGGTAEFSLLNANGSCTNPVLSGNYIKGSALGSSNTVQLQTYVITTGRFSLQTNSRNGFLFSATGSFSDTGIQTLTLTASGKPDSTGDFMFIPELAASCVFPVSVTGQQVPGTGYTIAGAPNACSNVQVAGEYQINKILTGSNTVVVNVNVFNTGDYIIQTDTLDGISFYAAGHFNQTGNQIVTLTGSGTPLLVQNLQFNLVGNGSACTFPLTVVNAGDSAIYSIASGVDHCVGRITGSYTAGTPLNASNTYTLTVYVSVAGVFSISTQPADGVVFSYTGRFIRLGTNFVTLTGHGTPTNAGSFTVTPEIIGPAPHGGQSCAFTLSIK